MKTSSSELGWLHVHGNDVEHHLNMSAIILRSFEPLFNPISYPMHVKKINPLLFMVSKNPSSNLMNKCV